MIRDCAVSLSLMTKTGLDFLLSLPLDELSRIAGAVTERRKN